MEGNINDAGYWWMKHKSGSGHIYWYGIIKGKSWSLYCNATMAVRMSSNTFCLVGWNMDQKMAPWWVEMPNLPWFKVEKETQRLKNIGMLERNYYLRPDHPQRKDPEDLSFTYTLRRKFVTGTPASLKSSVVILLYRLTLQWDPQPLSWKL